MNPDKGETRDNDTEGASGGTVCHLSGFVMESRVAVDLDMYI